MTRTVFRPAAPGDLEVYRSWFADAELARRLTPPTPAWHDFITTPGQAFWVALDLDGRPIVGIQTERDENGDIWFDCAIDPALRGTGRMGAILDDFIAGTGDGGRLIAEVEPDNAASIALLRRSGFLPASDPAGEDMIRFVREPNCGAS